MSTELMKRDIRGYIVNQILDYNWESGNAFSRVLMEIFQVRKVSWLFFVRDFLSGKVCLEWKSCFNS